MERRSQRGKEEERIPIIGLKLLRGGGTETNFFKKKEMLHRTRFVSNSGIRRNENTGILGKTGFAAMGDRPLGRRGFLGESSTKNIAKNEPE